MNHAVLARYSLVVVFAAWAVAVHAEIVESPVGADADSVTFAAVSLKNPFEWHDDKVAGLSDGLSAPDPNVFRSDGREVPISQLHLVGIVRSGTRAVALLSAGGAAVMARVGERIGGDGSESGEVSAIDNRSIHIRWPHRGADGQTRFAEQTLILREAIR